MVTFNEMGKVSYRTKLLLENKARGFARALEANARFSYVTVRESSRAKGPVRFFVTFSPSSASRCVALLDREQDARIRRVSERSYTVVKDPDGDWFHVLSHHSGETYETSLNHCGCPDWQFRCQPNGLACTHMLAVALAIRDETVQRFEPVPSPAQRREAERRAEQARFHAIFADMNEEWLR